MTDKKGDDAEFIDYLTDLLGNGVIRELAKNIPTLLKSSESVLGKVFLAIKEKAPSAASDLYFKCRDDPANQDKYINESIKELAEIGIKAYRQNFQ